MVLSKNKAINKIIGCLPDRIKNTLSSLEKTTIEKMTELRLHSDGCVGAVIGGDNYYLSKAGVTADSFFAFKTTQDEVEKVLYNLCGGSVFVHEDTLSQFFITVEGIRVGVSGKVKSTGEKGKGLCDIFGLCIRIPRHIENVSLDLYNSLLCQGFKEGCGVLIVSKPGVGKTTLLRDLALKLSGGKAPFRVCVIDERCEIYDKDLFSHSLCDFLQGVDKISGIETASRLFSPQIIICDEIACPEEAQKIAKIKSNGIIFICSLHADSARSALGKSFINAMFEDKVFDSIYELKRKENAIEGSFIRVNND